MAFSELNQVPVRKCRPLWQRLVTLMLCELVILQPGLATAQVSQLPNFTVTGLPPNVMLMFDDSASMARLTLPIPSGMPAMTASITHGAVTPHPVLKLHTGIGYFGIRGIGWAAGPGPTAANPPRVDNAWNFVQQEIRERSAAFNPLAYNPKIQYKPWNDNGTLMGQAPYGGNGLVESGALTPWDMRRLPTAPFLAPGATVASKITGASGLILESGAVKTFTTPTGSVDYAGLNSGTSGAETEGVDLFTSTIKWRNPYCASPGSDPDFEWFCPVGSKWANPAASLCDELTEVGNLAGQCCTSPTPGAINGSTGAFKDWKFLKGSVPPPPGPPYPSMAGHQGQACVTSVFLSTNTETGYDCVENTPAPTEIACGPGLEPPCYNNPPYSETCPGTRDFDYWRCNYTIPTYDADTCSPVNLSQQQCRINGSTPTCGGLEVLSDTSPAQYVSGYWTPARYVVYEGPVDVVTKKPAPADAANASNYRMVMIDRKFAWNPALNAGLGGRDPASPAYKYLVVDSLTGQTSYRPDCAAPPLGTGNAGQDGTWCTFEQEAQNYANWYTYYRTRLFSSIAVVSDVLSNFTGAEQRLRLGYGRINYFKNGRDPWHVNSIAPFYTSLSTIDGLANPGGIERGVREFLVSDPIGARADVFKWLFSINARGPTPNREALHTVGRYFQRADPLNPYVENPHGPVASAGDELWCRRNYAILATDGEWTKLPGQPKVEDGVTFTGADDPAAATTSMSTPGTPINGIFPDGTPRLSPFTYDPTVETHITGGPGGAQSTTLTDIAHYYWSHDLRPELSMKNGLLDSPANRAFWQHLSTYIVGYGLSASMDDDTLRPRFFASPPPPPAPPRQTIAWPKVGLEGCRQLDNNADDDALPGPNCGFTEPFGNRVNDTVRAALAGAGDFFSAASPVELRDSLASVFEAIVAENASGTSPSFSNTTLVPGAVFVRSRFRTNVWDGFVEAYDAKLYLDFLGGIGSEPPTVWTDNYVAHGTRNIATSTTKSNAVKFDWCNLLATQKNDLDPLGLACTLPPAPPAAVPAIVDYLRGDQSKERRFTGGLFRDRRTTILGDIVNSSPVYSKATDHAYQLQPAASFKAGVPHGHTGYRTYVTGKQSAAHKPIVMFGANDGMFHVLDATNGSGQEIFAYIPRAVYPVLRQYSNPAYTHRYTVDGPVIEGDVFTPASHATPGVWKTIAIGTTGAGPAGIFAIDITDPTTLDESKVLWDVVPADVSPYLGKTIGAGVIGSVRVDTDGNQATTPNGRWAYLVGNGYESASTRAALLVLDVFDGSLIQEIPVPMSAGPGNGLGAITPVYDGNRNIINVYAGDKKGNLWKFDLTSYNPANWKIANEDPPGVSRPLFAAGTTRPIVQAPRVTIHPRGGLYVVFGTGKYFEDTDPDDGNDQAIVALWDKGQLKDIAAGAVPVIKVEEYASGGQTFKRLDATDLNTYRTTTTAQGFQIRLRPASAATSKERIIAPLILDAGVLVATSFTPEASSDKCIPGGTSFLYRIDLAGGFTRGSFGTEGAITIGRKINPGTVGTMTPIYTPVDPGATKIEEMDSSQITDMMNAPRYTMGAGNIASQVGGFGSCVHAGLNVSGGVARVPTNCVGLYPLRAWRPFR